MKKIMILGAGTYQVPLILKAKEMGLYTIVISIEGKYPGFSYADKVYYIDTTDKEKILEVAQKEHIDGICTAGTDVAVPTIGFVCDALKLPGVSLAGAVNTSDKSRMKEAFEKARVNIAKYRTVYNEEDVKDALENLKFPVVFKAVDSSGSRGIVKVIDREKEGIKQAIDIVKKITKKEYFVIEEFLEGEEFGAQALVYNGTIQFIMPHGDYVYMGDTGVPIGHYVPYNIKKEMLEKVYEQTRLSLEALKLDNCAVNMDFIMCEDEVYVLEVGARSGATCLPEMVSIYYGIDYYKMILQTALGEEIEKICVNKEKTPNACKLIMAKETGVIKEIKLPDSRCGKLIDLSMDYSVGDTVKKFNIGPDRIGQVITCGNTLDEAVNVLENIYKEIYIKVE